MDLGYARGVQVTGGVTWVAIFFSRMCAQNYSGGRFIVPAQDPMLGPSPDPSLAGDWEVGLNRSLVSIILQPQF